MNIKKIQKLLGNTFSLGKKKRRKVPRRDIISIRENDGKRFQKRRKKVISLFLRKFSIPFAQKHVFYYTVWLWVIAIIGIIWLLVWPFLNVKEIYITRWNANVNIDLAYKAIDSLRWKKIFSIESSYVEDLLFKRQKSIEDIAVSFQLPGSINIEITSYPSVFQTSVKWQLYNIVENGAFIPTTNALEFPYIHIYTDLSTIWNIPDYKEILSPQHIEAIAYLKNSLIENLVQLQIDWLHYYVTERELIITLKSGGDLIFDLTKDLANQIEKIVIFHNEWWDITKKNLIYTDLRVNNKVFFCDISEEFLCRVNIKNIYWVKKKNPFTTETP